MRQLLGRVRVTRTLLQLHRIALQVSQGAKHAGSLRLQRRDVLQGALQLSSALHQLRLALRVRLRQRCSRQLGVLQGAVLGASLGCQLLSHAPRMSKLLCQRTLLRLQRGNARRELLAGGGGLQCLQAVRK